MGVLRAFSPDPLWISHLVLHGLRSRQTRGHWALTSRPYQWIR